MGGRSRPDGETGPIQSSQKSSTHPLLQVDFDPGSALGTPGLGTPNPPPLSPYPAFFTGISLAGLLGLGAVLSAAATVREAGRLMAGVSLHTSRRPSTPGWTLDWRGYKPLPTVSRQKTWTEPCGPVRARPPGPTSPVILTL